MLINPIDFEKKLNKEYNIKREALLSVFNNATDDAEFIKELNNGYKPYLVLDINNKETFSVLNIKEDTKGVEFINQDHIVAVEGFKYLRVILAS